MISYERGIPVAQISLESTKFASRNALNRPIISVAGLYPHQGLVTRGLSLASLSSLARDPPTCAVIFMITPWQGTAPHARSSATLRSEYNMAYARQSWPDSGLDFKVKVLEEC